MFFQKENLKKQHGVNQQQLWETQPAWLSINKTSYSLALLWFFMYFCSPPHMQRYFANRNIVFLSIIGVKGEKK